MWFSVHSGISVVQRSIYKFIVFDGQGAVPRISLMNTAISSYKLVAVAYQICMTILIPLHCTC